MILAKRMCGRPRRLPLRLVVSSSIFWVVAVAKPRLGAGGVQEGRLAPCPDSPNCVSTQAPPDDKTHYIQPVAFSGEAKRALRALSEAVGEVPRSKVVKRDKRYLHAEFRSRVFRFVDDVEFFVDNDAKLIHFRSASRVGRGDMGANRKRMERLRNRIEAKLR